MSNISQNETESQSSKYEEFYDKNNYLTIDSLNLQKELENICENLFALTNEESIKQLNSKLNDLNTIVVNNIELENQIRTKQQNAIKQLVSKSELNINNKPLNDLTENDLVVYHKELQTSVNCLKSELINKKDLKTELSNKVRHLQQMVEQLKNESQNLMKEKAENKSNECKTLANVMRVMYKTYNKSKVVGLVFNDDENLERLIVVDKENKSEQEIAEEFWSSLNQDYDI